MSEVQALELRISDNAVETAKALSSLASTLSKLKGTISQGLGLNKVQGDLGKLQTSLRINIPDSTMTRLTALAGTLERIAKAAKEISALKNVPGVGQAMGLGGTATGGSKKTGVTQVAPRTMEVVADATREVGKAAEEANRSVQKFATTITTVTGKGKDGMYGWGGIRSSMTGQALASAADRRRALEQTMAQHVGKGAAEMLGGKNATQEVQQRVQVLQEGVKAADALQTRTNEQAQAQAQVNEQAAGAARQVEQIKATTEQASSSTRSLATNMEESGKRAKLFEFHMRSASGGIMSIVKGLARVARYRFFRYIITTLTKSIKEGLENFRGYSKAIKGLYSKDMTALDNAVLKMKNSVGAALAPAFQLLIPIIQNVVSWIITASNYVTQFFALLRGESTWSKALDVTASDFEKTKNSANGAAKAAKELLASWDELNIISQEGGGGGGGNSLTDADYKKMYEEVGVFDGKIKEVVGWIKDNMDSVNKIVKEIGAVLLAWTVGPAIGGIFGILGSLLGAGGIIKIMFDVETMLNGKFMETGEDGWLVASALTSLLGATLAGKVLAPILGAGMASVAFGIAMLVTAGASIKAVVENADVDAFSEKNLKQTLLGSIAAGYGAWKIAGGLKTTKWGAEKITTGTKVDAMLGSALMVIGVTVGIKAIQRAEAGEGWTNEQIRDTIVSSITLGGGAGLLAAAFGASVATALATGTVVALAAAAAIALTVYVNTHTAPGIIDYGGISLAEDEIRDYVNTNMFTIDIEANIRIIDAKLEMLNTAKDKVRDRLAEAVPLMDVVRMDLDTPETLNQLKKTLLGENGDGTGGLIGAMKEELSTALGIISVNMTLFGDSKDGTTKDYETIFGDFTDITNWFGEKGDALGAAFKDGATEQIAQITDEVIRVTTAMSNAQARAGLMGRAASLKSEYRDYGMGDFTKETVAAIVSEYKSMRTEAVERYTASANAEAAEYESRAAFYRETNQADKAQFYADEAQRMYERIASGEIEQEALAAAKPGLDMIRNFLMEKVPNGFNFMSQANTATPANIVQTAGSREEFESRFIEYWLGGGNNPFGNAKDIILPLLEMGAVSLTDLFNEGDIYRWINHTTRGGQKNEGALSWYRSSDELAQEREAARDRTRNATLSNARKQLEFLGISIPEMIDGISEPVKKIEAEYDDGPEFSMAEILAESAETVEETMDGVAGVVSAAVDGAAKIEEAAYESDYFGLLDNVNNEEYDPAQEVYLWMHENYNSPEMIDRWNTYFEEMLDGMGNELDYDELADHFSETLGYMTRDLIPGGAGLDNEEYFRGFTDFLGDLYYLMPGAEAAENMQTVWNILSEKFGHAPTEFFEGDGSEDGDMADDVSRGTAGTEQRVDETNRLLVVVSNILTQILNKPNNVTFSPTPSFGRVVEQSRSMYGRTGGLTLDTVK